VADTLYRPPGAAQTAGPDSSSHTAGPDSSSHFAGPNSSHTAGPDSSSHTAGPDSSPHTTGPDSCSHTDGPDSSSHTARPDSWYEEGTACLNSLASTAAVAAIPPASLAQVDLAAMAAAQPRDDAATAHNAEDSWCAHITGAAQAGGAHLSGSRFSPPFTRWRTRG
jgi:hypothetical protein